MQNKYETPNIPLTRFFSNANVSKIKTVEIPLFANISIIDKVVRIPCLIDYVPFHTEMNGLLNEAHENTKRYLAELRKNSTNNQINQLPSQ